MKDFLGSFAEGLTNQLRAYLLPSAVALGLWDFFVFDHAKRDSGTLYARLREIGGSNDLLVFAGGVIAVALLLGVLTPTATRWLEGYWWGRNHTKGPALAIWTWRVTRHHAKRKALIITINGLAERQSPSPAERARLSSSQSRLRRYPEFPSPTMPTRLGNVLRAGEQYGSVRYGIDTINMWDVLLPGVPEPLAEAQVNRRTSLDLFVSTAVLPLVFLLATWHAVIVTDLGWNRLVPVAVVGAVISLASYLAAVEVAASYADSIRAVVELGRAPLAKSLGLTLPARIEDEFQLWRAVSGFVSFGLANSRRNGWIANLEAARCPASTRGVDSGDAVQPTTEPGAA